MSNVCGLLQSTLIKVNARQSLRANLFTLELRFPFLSQRLSLLPRLESTHMAFKQIVAGLLISTLLSGILMAQEMDKLWGDRVVKLRADKAERGQLFDEGNYAMFIHWGLYSQLGNKVEDKTYYGIGEWIMNPRMAGIPVKKYMELASTFNPEKFDAKKIVQTAKDAGMKYIVITAKHHDGFAMYHSKVNKFNIVDATPWKKDPMKELASECREQGLGFGFYYSHNQDVSGWPRPQS